MLNAGNLEIGAGFDLGNRQIVAVKPQDKVFAQLVAKAYICIKYFIDVEIFHAV